jgi:hypothetical protein
MSVTLAIRSGSVENLNLCDRHGLHPVFNATLPPSSLPDLQVPVQQTGQPVRHPVLPRRRFRAVVAAKLEGNEVVAPPESEEEGGEVLDLLAALQQSVNRAKAARGEPVEDSDSAPSAPAPAKAGAKTADKKATAKKGTAKKATAKKHPAKKSTAKKSAAKKAG